MSFLRALTARARALGESKEDSAETESVRRIVSALDRLEPERARFIAAFAYILGRVARADMTIDESETRKMETIVVERGSLTQEQAILIVQIAKSQAVLFGGTENFLVTREFDRMASREQKAALLECLFAVAATHEGISVAEDNEIRRISQELHLTHREFIAARSQFRDALAVLKRPPRPKR